MMGSIMVIPLNQGPLHTPKNIVIRITKKNKRLRIFWNSSMGFNGTGREHGEGHGAAGSIEDSGSLGLRSSRV